ncbi:IS21 family transposase [Kitasatospora purpeofusca]|uniref:IS21 family transposase n=1 Tax=Kitasatospora purpeofusca TaxID=67352 RepID=UPI002257EF21|nr:IS21 family transposase [Kitasatospora purpeofusca]MCX4757127.1 IS21 family transposase [Kitasatospora purpeofusca]WSR35111.1 IS21 family transposase [Kitasatospora purpeofusca]WSR37792.1 IS21 family transposase [Kitasatospora purpeofusca]WSR43357.1 IS21 family transposase [Kitasatospora purpeofusca]WSR45960.1 IS21 family transposase [Kitasatospora purpeofusca]
MKNSREIMEILEAYDLTGSYRSAAELAGCDHHTVARYVKMRAAGLQPDQRRHRDRAIDAFLPKIEELVVRSGGRIRADVVHKRISAMGFTGGERTTRRTVAEAKAQFRAGQRRIYRPWITEPALWLQWDWGEGPTIGGRRTSLWCAWLAWSRFRVVIPVWDKTLPTITACLDATLRRIGGVPAYALTDNEKTVSTDHIAGIAVRNPEIVEVARHYGMTIRTCLPADPETKGGSEATVRIAKADLVPKDVNLLEEYRSFAVLEAACRSFCEEVNNRVHRETRRRPVEMLAEEQQRLHPLPKQPFTVAFGTTRRVNWDATISVEAVRYSVPHPLIDTRVWARFHGDELIVTAVQADGTASEVARHQRGTPGSPVIDEAHYPERENKEGDRTPRATSAEEAAFLMLGPGAAAWLVEAATAGTRRVKAKMAEAVSLSKLFPAAQVDRALGTAAVTGRFAEKDLLSILDYQARHGIPEPTRASEAHSLQPGTSAWARFGTTTSSDATDDDEQDDFR